MKPARLPGSAGASVARVRRWSTEGGWSRAEDAVAAEEPLELRVNTRPVAVVMRTPGHDEELAAGFLLTEAVVRSPLDIAAIRAHPRNRDGNVLDVFLDPRVELDLARLSRHVFAASSCGLCGKASIDAVRQQFPRVRDRFQVEAGVLSRLPGVMQEAQAVFAATGGLHAAGFFGLDGTLRLLREDVGRHNAVDKVLGRLLLDGRLPQSRGILMVSGRASFEILQKALAGGVGVVAAVGAPSSLAVDFARHAGQTLVGFLRAGRFNVYAGTARVR